MEQTRRGSGAPWIMEVAVGHRLWHIAQADETLDSLPPFLAANSPKEASSRIERLQQETGTGRALQGIESQAAWSGWAWGLGGLGAWGLGTSPTFLRLRGPHGHNKVPPHRTQGRKKTRPGEDGFCRPWNGSLRRHSRATRDQSFCEDMNES
jgi:hypothetical protein